MEDTARLELIDSLLQKGDPAACAESTLEWLARHGGLERGLCAVLDSDQRSLMGIAGYGLAPDEVAAFHLRLDNPGRSPGALFEGRLADAGADSEERALLAEPFGRVVALSIAGGRPEDRLGLLLTDGPGIGNGTGGEAIDWAARVLANRLAALQHRRETVQGRRIWRERAWLREILEAESDPILLTDADGKMLIANERAEKLLSADEQMSEGRRRAVSLNNMLFSASLFTAVEEQTPSRREVLLVDPIDGQDLLFELLPTPVPVRPGETGTVSILRDVTDLRQATEEIEENYRKLQAAEVKTRAERDRLDLVLNSVVDPVLVTDAAGSIVLMNPPAERLFTVEQNEGTEEARRRVRANDVMLSSFLSNLYAGRSAHWRGEMTLADPATGDSVPVEGIAGRVQGRTGEDTAVVTILHDLTEAMEKASLYEQVKRHSEELETRVQEATAELAEQNELLRRQALELEQASAMKSQFLANVSHELRTPLNAMLGYTELLLEGIYGELSTGQRERLERVDANAQHLLLIINDLLDIARIEAGKMPVDSERFELSELIDEVMAEVEPLIAMSELEVRVEIDREVPGLESDRKKIKQILINLLSNALKFTPEGSVVVHAQWRADAGQVAVGVADTGIGISEKNQKTIFEAFGQSDSSNAGKQDGTGLGLSICRRLATLLGGDITLDSCEGEGSTFTLLLPVAVEVAT